VERRSSLGTAIEAETKLLISYQAGGRDAENPCFATVPTKRRRRRIIVDAIRYPSPVAMSTISFAN
jgi:hypothetical protein